MNLKLKIFSALTLTSLLCSAQDIRKNTLESFNAITVSDAINIKYIVSETPKIVFKGAESDFDKIEYNITGGTLYIKSKGSINNTIRVEISGNKLNGVTTSGASSVKSEDEISSNEFKIDASGASNINLNLAVNKLNLIAGGASDINLKGKAQVAEETITGAVTLKSYNLITDTLSIITSGAATAKIYSNKKLAINATGASTVKFKGEPTEVSAEGGSSSKIMKISSDASAVKKELSDTSKNKTSFRYKNKEIIIIDNDKKYNINVQNSELTRKHWQGLWLGFAGYTNPNMGFSMNKPYNYMTLDYARSYSFQWNIYQNDINLYKKLVLLSTGLGLQFNSLKFDYNTRLNADSSFTWGIIDSSSDLNYRKSRFIQSYLTVPLLLTFNSSKKLKHNFHITAGVIGKGILNSSTKVVLIKNSDNYEITRKDSYNLNPFQIDAYASLGYRNFTIYAQYAITEMFKKEKGPELYPFTVGIRLFSFD